MIALGWSLLVAGSVGVGLMTGRLSTADHPAWVLGVAASPTLVIAGALLATYH